MKKEICIVVGSKPAFSEQEHGLVLDYPKVESSHCRISVLGNQMFVENLSEKGGTFVNYKRIEKQTQINDEDIITLSKTIPLSQSLLQRKLHSIKPLAPIENSSSDSDLNLFVRRSFAYALDLFFLIGFAYLLFLLHNELQNQLDSMVYRNLLSVLVIAIFIAFYFIIIISPRKISGATLGKYMFGLRTRDGYSGGNLDLIGSWTRSLAKLISVLTFGIGFFRFWLREDRLTLHDYLTKTVVDRVDTHQQ